MLTTLNNVANANIFAKIVFLYILNAFNRKMKGFVLKVLKILNHYSKRYDKLYYFLSYFYFIRDIKKIEKLNNVFYWIHKIGRNFLLFKNLLLKKFYQKSTECSKFQCRQTCS